MYNNIGLSLVVGMVFIFAVMGFWYISYPIAASIISFAESISISGGWSTSGSTTTYLLLQFVVTVGGAVFVVLLLLWMVSLAQQQDWRGYYE